MATIELDHLVKRFADGTEAVHEATFTIEDGEFFILVGPSGCGKSTLLNMIVGLEDISGGSLKVDGKEVNDVDPKDRNMAMVFQSYAIYPHLTVRENMEFPLKLRKMGAAEIKQRVDDAAAILELGELLDRKPAKLSGGQRQRVAMGRAIVREPEAFLMDEPLSNLDAKLRVQMRTEISRLQRRLATTTVYVTHDQVEAMTLGDRVAVLRKGHVLQVGTPRDLYDDPANLFVAGFIGSPAMNLLPVGEADGVAGDVVRLPMVDVPVEGALAETIRTAKGQVIAGIRPEHIQAAETVDDAVRPHGVTFTATLEVVEWLGAELFVYFDVEGGSSGELDMLAKELENAELGSGDEARVSARISPDAAAREGQDIELWLDARRLHLFDAATGESLRRKAAVRTEPAAAATDAG